MNSFSPIGILKAEDGFREEDTDGRVAAESARFRCRFCARSHRSCSRQHYPDMPTSDPPSSPSFVSALSTNTNKIRQ